MKKSVVFILLFLMGGSLNADLLIGDAGFFQMSPSQKVLITYNLDGGLGVSITDQGAGSYEFTPAIAGDPYRLYTAAFNLEFDPDYANASTPIVPGTSSQSFFSGETKYYAYWEETAGAAGPDVGDNYGWVAIMYNGSDLVITDSATAESSAGIIVGTYTQIPEPATVLLFGLGGFCAWFLRRKVL